MVATLRTTSHLKKSYESNELTFIIIMNNFPILVEFEPFLEDSNQFSNTSVNGTLVISTNAKHDTFHSYLCGFHFLPEFVHHTTQVKSNSTQYIFFLLPSSFVCCYNNTDILDRSKIPSSNRLGYGLSSLRASGMEKKFSLRFRN